MTPLPYSLVRPLLFRLDPERAHDLTLRMLGRIQHTPLIGLLRQRRPDDPVTLAGIRFPNRVGLAAGLDKNGRAIDGLAALGFGFVEVGTVTPRAQPGNPKPRMFRLPEAGALINRAGFNNDGLDAFLANVAAARFREHGGILGLNIGKNAATPIEDATSDYLLGMDAVYPHADYIAVNISSPNTANLRELQQDAALGVLLSALSERRALLQAEHRREVPLFLKIAPDVDDAQVAAIAAAVAAHGIDGVIATNTTLSREGVRGLEHAEEAGGLSGPPVRAASDRVIARLRSEAGPGLPIIGVGGISSGDDARAKIAAGADLVQIYTGLIYRGPALVREVGEALARDRQ